MWVAVGAAAQELSATAVSTAPAIPCGGDAVLRGPVGRVLDGRNFVLDDGRTVHLAGIEVPVSSSANAAYRVPGAAAARAALAALISGADIELRPSVVNPDRYGRIVAYVEVVRDGQRRSAQAEMIAAGFARAGADIASQACAAELLRRETAARKAKRGLWAERYYEPLQAGDSAAILERRGHFALIEGKVVSVHASGATVYVNFGQHWSQDFAVTIRKRNERNFAAAGADPNRLTGRRVLVRGWIQAHGGNSGAIERGFWRAPWVDAEYPEQIELSGND